MVKKVVYVLGAGFSAPMGIPVIGTFKEKSEEMFRQDREKYKHFEGVFEMVRDLSVSRRFYTTDVENIEEVLSTIEMKEFLAGGSLSPQLVRYIADVVKSSTPDMPPLDKKQSLGMVHLFGLGGLTDIWHHYGCFIVSLFGTAAAKVDGAATHQAAGVSFTEAKEEPAAVYSIITLNYDRILETVVEFVNDSYKVEPPLQFAQASKASPITNIAHARHKVYMAKLHGTVSENEDEQIIVPPTWSKGRDSKIVPAWKLAYQLLAEATDIRFIGYSLPLADSYVKYLLKASSIDDPVLPPLKRVDVICRDSSGEVEKRYKQFLGLTNWRFKKSDAQKYLDAITLKYDSMLRYGPESQLILYPFDQLEQVHSDFMDLASIEETYG